MKKLLVLACLFLVGSAMGAAYNHKVRLTKMGADSLYITAFRGNGDSVSTTNVTSFPYAGNIALDDTCSWVLQFKWWYPTETLYTVVPLSKPFQDVNGILAVDSINAILDTLQLYDGRYALASELTKAIDSLNAILDTLQLYDGRYSLASELTKVTDTVNAILDTLQLYDASGHLAVTTDAYGAGDAPPSASTIAGAVWSESGRDLSTSPPTAAAIADAVWDEDSSGHMADPLNMAVIASQTAAGTTPPTAAQIWAYATRTLSDTTNISKLATDAASKTWATTTRTLSDTNNLSKLATDAAAKTWASVARTLTDSTNLSKIATDAAAKTWATAIGTKLVTTSVISPDAISATALSDAAGNEIADQIWDEDSTAHLSVGTMGSSASQTAALSLTPAQIWAYSPRVLTSGAVTAVVDTASIARSVWSNSFTTQASRTVTASLDTVVLYRIIARTIGDSLLQITSTAVLNDTAGVAGDVLSNFSDYRNAIKRRCGVDIANTLWMADTIMNDFVKEAVAAVNPIIMGRRITDTVTTTFQENTYKIDSNIIGLFSVSFLKYDSVKGMLPVPRTMWYQQEHKTTKGQTDGYLKRPSYYDFIDGYLSVCPAPNIVGDTMIITGWSRIPNLASAASISLIPQQYRSVILEYAAWKVAESKQHPMATAFHANFTELVDRLARMLNAQEVKK